MIRSWVWNYIDESRTGFCYIRPEIDSLPSLLSPAKSVKRYAETVCGFHHFELNSKRRIYMYTTHETGGSPRSCPFCISRDDAEHISQKRDRMMKAAKKKGRGMET
jgi:hypothetical protein